MQYASDEISKQHILRHLWYSNKFDIYLSFVTKFAGVIPQLRIAIVGKDSGIFVKNLVKTYPKFNSDEKTPETNDPYTRYRGEVRDQLVLFLDVGDLEWVHYETAPCPANLISIFSEVSAEVLY